MNFKECKFELLLFFCKMMGGFGIYARVYVFLKRENLVYMCEFNGMFVCAHGCIFIEGENEWKAYICIYLTLTLQFFNKNKGTTFVAILQ